MNEETQVEQLIHETPGATPNFRTKLAVKLAELVPEAIADGKVDLAKLKELLDGDVGDENERFGLFWPGKRKAMRAAQEPTTATLRPDKENSKDWDTTQNVFIEGDNLEVLKILQKHYHNKIKMIYIDPPYNTGKDFVYPDNFKEGLETYLEWTNQVNENGKKVSTNSESEGRYHSNWLNMLYPRLKLARNLLTDDGLIFISIDDNEKDNLKKLCDEIFGESNQVNTIVWKNRYNAAKEKHLAKVHEYVLVYARNIAHVDPIYVPTTEEYIGKYFKLKDAKYGSRGPYRLQPLEAGRSMDFRKNLTYSVPAPDGTLVSPKRQWKWSEDRTLEALEKNDLEFTKTSEGWSISTKQYLKDENGQ